MNDTKIRNQSSFCSGFAAPGMLLNITLGGLVVLGSSSFCLSNMNKVATMAAFPSLNGQGQAASCLLAQDIRRASSVESASSDRLVLRVPAAEGVTRLIYCYDSAARTLTRADGKLNRTVLTEVDALTFSVFQRPAADAAYNTLTPATATQAKLVGCRWSCSRKLGGTKMDAESVQMAPVVLRNRC